MGWYEKKVYLCNMKLKFTIPYRANWGESLYVDITFIAVDGHVHHEDVLMQTSDGETWMVETQALDNRQHPYRGIAYYYKVVDGDGKEIRRESVLTPRVYPYDSTHNFEFSDFWLDDEREFSEEYLNLDAKVDWKVDMIPHQPLFDRTVIFRVKAPRLYDGEAVGILGNHPILGNWNTDHYLQMEPTEDGGWILSLNIQALETPLEYKYVIYDAKTQKFKRWEYGDNRTMGQQRIYAGYVNVLHGGEFRTKKMPAHAEFNFDTYIFDLDGTLLSTLRDLAASCNYALKHHDMPVRTLEEVRRFVGNGVKKLMERAVPDGLDNPAFDKVYQDFRQHYMIHNLDTTKPYPGIMEMLAELKARGKNIAVVSNKFYAATQTLCRHFFGDLVDVAIGEREDIKKKPAPDTVNEALRQLGADRHKAVYIGDSDVDVMTARNSQMPCISVLWGFRDREFLIAHDATIFVSAPSQIL